MNNVVLMGRLTRDPVQRMAQTANGEVESARFTLAVNRRAQKDGESQADFISCIAWGRIAEVINKYTKKGTKIAVGGRIQTGSYKNRDGNTVYTTDVVVSTMEFAESKQNDNGQQDDRSFMDVPDDVSDEGLPFN